MIWESKAAIKWSVSPANMNNITSIMGAVVWNGDTTGGLGSFWDYLPFVGSARSGIAAGKACAPFVKHFFAGN